MYKHFHSIYISHYHVHSMHTEMVVVYSKGTAYLVHHLVVWVYYLVVCSSQETEQEECSNG